ncbi:hypothetical protein EV200_106327 [Pedobacter psychrotolerans]|uniref:Uncharacterized protein n=1 Tax=Pedobacter psychrotolerans TaxID=1843235 RepID=A0A4V2RYY5_9SPHI|nr:hypothetical protein [Pedobacter psychrotolerans]TCO22682.1 hypothetical protein EV200_106327 [Pedobacter psychrotolerans]GGE66360.1 hypothetical protein GCM10011413_36120 [Pedobacter psychrotolerans]
MLSLVHENAFIDLFTGPCFLWFESSGGRVDQVIGHWELKDITKAAGKEVVLVDSVYDGRTFENHTVLNVGAVSLTS